MNDEQNTGNKCDCCDGSGECPEMCGADEECEVCDGTGECPHCSGSGER